MFIKSSVKRDKINSDRYFCIVRNYSIIISIIRNCIANEKSYTR